MTIIEQLDEAQNFKVKNYQILAKYFRDKGLEIENKKIDDIVAETYVSGATIVRFCKKLGYSGFSNFKYELCEEYRLFSYNRESQLSMTYFNKLNIIHQKLKPQIQDKKIYRTINTIKAKKIISIICDTNELHLCSDFRDFLIKKGKIVMCSDSIEAKQQLINNLNKDVLYIVVDFRGLLRENKQLLNQNNIFVISNYNHEYGDYNLIIPQVADTEMCAVRLNETVLKNVFDLIELNI